MPTWDAWEQSDGSFLRVKIDEVVRCCLTQPRLYTTSLEAQYKTIPPQGGIGTYVAFSGLIARYADFLSLVSPLSLLFIHSPLSSWHVQNKGNHRANRLGTALSASGPRPTGPDIPIDRTEIRLDRIRIFGWPSRGGVIVLSGTTRADFEYLGWDALDPPLRRDKDQDAEDEVCKKLLLLGETWFDSQSRFKLLAAVLDNSESIRELFYEGKVHGVTRTESMWVRVGWPSSGGLWVTEFSDPRFEAVMDKDAECFDCDWVDDSGLFGLAKDMDERCEILMKIGGKFYASVNDYDGHGCLKAWEDKTRGEVGPLAVTRYQELLL